MAHKSLIKKKKFLSCKTGFNRLRKDLYLKGIEKSERLKEKYGFAPYEDVYQEYCRLCESYKMVVPSFEEWIPKEECRRENLCRTDEKYKDYKFVSYKNYKKD